MPNKRNIHAKSVLITGGAGFIGSNLVEALLGQDNHVVCLDNFFTGRRRNIEPFLANPRFSLIEGDIRDLDTCRPGLATASTSSSFRE